jgi:uncharacterized protein (TIRG00374 family)
VTFACWPPGPDDRLARSTTSSSGTVTSRVGWSASSIPGSLPVTVPKVSEETTAAVVAGEDDEQQRRLHRQVLKWAFLLTLMGVSLYFVAPTLLQTLGSWDQLRDVEPLWLIAMFFLQGAALACLWIQQRLCIRAKELGPVITSQLAANALGKVVPGGGATAGALQYKMLVEAGTRPGATAVGLTASSLLVLAILLLLPVLAIPAIILRGADQGLVNTAIVGFIAFVLMAVAGAVLLIFDAPLRDLATVIQRLHNRILRRHRQIHDLPERFIRERDRILKVLGRHWWQALLATIGRWLFDYATLLAALAGVGAHPRPSLVLLAFAVAQILAQIPATPGGLGFVEAGLTATLRLAGVPAGAAVVATFAYRFFSYWLAMPAGAVAAAVHRRRYAARARAPEVAEARV